MSWASGNKKWTMTFKSLSEVTCKVDIYKRGYTGSAVTTLTGAADPFEWDEDDSDSLLNVIRTKTGYLRVVESTYGSLSELYPSTDIDHYIEFYYGSTLYFTGFMQAQAFGSEWGPGPRVVEFPIQSPLATAEGLHFTAPATPGFVSVGSVLKQACNILDANISHVIFPSEMRILTQAFTFRWMINSLVYCPFNSNFSRYQTNNNPLYDPQSIAFFIEALCNCFGLMVHDMPGYLIFSRFDYTGGYRDYEVSSLDGTLSYTESTAGNNLIDMESLPILGDDGEEKAILPVHELTLEFEGDMTDETSVNWEHAKLNGVQGSYSAEVFYAVMVPQGDEVLSDYLQTVIPPNGQNDATGVWMCAIGTDSLQECFLIHPSASWAADTKILRYRYFNLPKSTSFSVSVSLKRGNSLNELGGGWANVGIIVKNGDKYYSEEDSQWVNEETINYVLREDGTDDLVLQVAYWCPNGTSPLDIIITNHGMVNTLLYTIEDIIITAGSTPETEYAFDMDNAMKKSYKSENGSSETATVDLNFSVAVMNTNQVVPPGSEATQQGYIPCNYSYMLLSQNRVKVPTFITHAVNLYTLLASFYVTGWRWRIIGIGFNPWDDKMQVIFQRSPVLE